MKKVILESPYAGNIVRNELYAELCIRDSLYKGEAPLASHLLYTRPNVLDDMIPEERTMGIEAGLVWLPHADLHEIYCDLGWSTGMREAHEIAVATGKQVEIRYLGLTAESLDEEVYTDAGE